MKQELDQLDILANLGQIYHDINKSKDTGSVQSVRSILADIYYKLTAEWEELEE